MNKLTAVVLCIWVLTIGYIIGTVSYAQSISAKVLAMLADSSGNPITSLNALHVRLAETIAGEDVLVDVLKTEQRFTHLNITGQATTVVKSGAGMLHSIIINTAAANAVIRCRDNTADSGTLIGQITQPATLLENQKMLLYDLTFSVGLTCVTATASQDITVVYR